MLSKEYVMSLLKEFNKAIRNSSYYRGRSNFVKGRQTGNLATASWLELPLKKDVAAAVNGRGIVNFEYLVSGRRRFICFDKGRFDYKSIVGGDRIFKELGFRVCNEDEMWVARNNLHVEEFEKGHLQLVSTNLNNKYVIRVVALY